MPTAVSQSGLELTSLHKSGECHLLSRPPVGEHGKSEVGRGSRSTISYHVLFLLLIPRVAENQRHPRAQEISEWEKEQGSLSMQLLYSRAVVTQQSGKPGLGAVDPMPLWPHLHPSKPESLTPFFLVIPALSSFPWWWAMAMDHWVGAYPKVGKQEL